MSENSYNQNPAKKSNSTLTSVSVAKEGQGNVLLVTALTGLGFNMAPHFGMYQILNYLRYKNLKCDMYDRDLEFFKKTNFDENAVLADIKEGKYDVIGISVSQHKGRGKQVMIDDLDLIWKMREAAKASGKMPIFVAGGQAAALNHKQWLDSGIDLIVLGFGEKTFSDICEKYFTIPKPIRNVSNLIDIAESIRGVSFKAKNGIYRYTPTRHVTKELFTELFLDFPKKYDMPFKAFWDIMKQNTANSGQMGASEFIFENVRVYTSSHCPRMCGFCNSGQFLKEMTVSEDDLMIDKEGLRFSTGRQKLIQLDPKELIDLIMYYIKKYGAKSFLFSDDDFALKSKLNRVKGFCKLVREYKEKGLMDESVQFHCQTHVTDWLGSDKKANVELIKDVVSAGFKSISVGVESFTDRVMMEPSLNKNGYTNENARDVLDTMLANGIVPQVNVILGIPEYTPEDLLETANAAIEYLVKGCDLSVSRNVMALPGAPIYESGLYEVDYDTWTHPVTDKVMKIPYSIIPKDPLVAKAMEVFDIEAQKKLEEVKKKMNWNDKTAPKRVIEIAALTCLPKLLNRDDLTPKYEKVLDDVLAGKYRQNAGVSYDEIAGQE
jgi:radical SAM superfamily enzyme YgiQ (UPF0313 family)